MEVLTALVVKVTEDGLLSSFRGCTAIIQWTSIYADDVVMFIKPTVSDLVVARETLKIFRTASGLRMNYIKSSATLIRGDAQDEILVSALLEPIARFPIKYLGLQLVIRPLTKAEGQPVLDKFLVCIPLWQGGTIAKEGMLVLIKSARPLH
jgi:hypothetical protein